MRRFPVVSCTLLAALAACSGEMSVEEARSAAVVTVGGVTLDGATLEQVLLNTPPASPGPTRETAGVVLSAFIDAALLREALVRGDSLTDSALVHQAIVPDAIRGQILTLLQRRAAAMPEVTDEQADSLGRLGTVRVLQHILFRVPDWRDSIAVQGIGRRATTVLRDIKDAGADFAAMARQHSEDTLTAPGGGFLPPVQRRDLPQGEPRLVESAWALSPGDVSNLVLSQLGVHIIRRATLVEGRPGFKQWLRPVLARKADSTWIDSLSTSKGLTIDRDVVARIRELALEPFSGGGDAPFATWQGGELTADETRMWVSVLPVAERASLPVAPDTSITLMIEQLAERDIVAEIAGEGATVSPLAWQALAPQYRAAITAVAEQYRDALVVGDSSAAVRNFLVAISTGERPYRPLPGALAGILRRRAEITVDQAVVSAIVTAAAREWQLRFGRDSTGADSMPPAGDSGQAATP